MDIWEKVNVKYSIQLADHLVHVYFLPLCGILS